MKRFDVRVQIIEALKEKGLYVETKDNAMVVPLCAKTGDIIEPLLKPQWWVRCKDMAEAGMEAVKDGRLEILPKQSEKEWYRWLGNMHDWCVSRQLWWGHRVPAYFVAMEGVEQDRSSEEYWIVGRTLEEVEERAKAKFPGATYTLEQDPDVLDTWFSSALWPFSIFGWPDQTQDLEIFYPNTVLETGWDILFFWVARMVMFGMKLTGKVPFKQVFCHAMIRDAHGRKMSKSLGNVIDPVSVIEGISLEGLHASVRTGNLDEKEVNKAIAGQKADFPNGIPECGTDALRFGLCAYQSTGRDINLDILRVEGYRKFCNKLWNATRFALMKLGSDFVPRGSSINSGESLAQRWILHRLNETVGAMNQALHERNFMTATSTIHGFWLYDLCDVFIEVAKPIIDGDDEVLRRSYQDTLYDCLEGGLLLLHPLMPFVTEELYQRLPRRPNATAESIMVAAFPEKLDALVNEPSQQDFELVFNLVKAARSLMNDYSIASNATLYLVGSTDYLVQLLKQQSHIVQTLVKGCKTIHVQSASDPTPAGCALATITSECNLLLLVKGSVDMDAEIAKLEAKLSKATKLLESSIAKTKMEGYETKIKEEVRQANQVKIDTYQTEVSLIQTSLVNFTQLKNEV
jgi:valyl-tRNA synthetase